jgi:hypothetical protein
MTHPTADTTDPRVAPVLDWLRDTAPQLSGTTGTPAAAANALWAARFADILTAPGWEHLHTAENLGNPLTVLAAGVPGHPGLTLLAACLPLADDHAVTFAALRTCRDEHHCNVETLASPRNLAHVLQRSAVGGRIDHDHCHPRHGGPSVALRMNWEDADQAAAEVDARPVGGGTS